MDVFSSALTALRHKERLITVGGKKEGWEKQNLAILPPDISQAKINSEAILALRAKTM